MADVTQDDLAWDYTADECSPLLRRAVSPYGRRNEPCTLTRNQAHCLLRSLSEAAQILNANLRQRAPDEGRATETDSTHGRIYDLYHRVVRYFPVITITLQILSVLIDTVVDAGSGIHACTTNKPYTSAVLISFGAALTILFYVDIMQRFLEQRTTVVSILASFISSSILFANIYTVFYCFDKSVWFARAAVESQDIYVVAFLRMVHVSISVFTFSQNASGIQVVAWYPLSVLSIQMLLAYCHLLLIVVLILGSFLPRTHSVVPNGPFECPPLVREPDTESLSFGTNLTTVVNSNPINVVDHGRAHSEEQGTLLLSNSI